MTDADKNARIAELEAAVVRATVGFMRCQSGQLMLPMNVRVQVGDVYRVRVDLDDGKRVYAAMPFDQAMRGMK